MSKSEFMFLQKENEYLKVMIITLFSTVWPQRAEWTLNKIEKIFNGPLHGERECFRGSEYVLFEILD